MQLTQSWLQIQQISWLDTVPKHFISKFVEIDLKHQFPKRTPI